MHQWSLLNQRKDCQATLHETPASALQAALAAADPADRIVVFGSFFTVGGILKQGLPQLSAPHLLNS
jgi:dihydrofolate synthase/folylpolyglutamate synthase